MNGFPRQRNELSLLKEEYISHSTACCAAEKPKKKRAYIFTYGASGLREFNTWTKYSITQKLSV